MKKIILWAVIILLLSSLLYMAKECMVTKAMEVEKGRRDVGRVEKNELMSSSPSKVKDLSCIVALEQNKDKKAKVVKSTLKNYFSSRDDMCEGTDKHSCSNRFETIRNLQIALNLDKNLDVNLTEDGQWGKNTKKAVELYQKQYNLSPVNGWVDKKIREHLDKTAKEVQYPSDYFSRHDDMCESTTEHSCTNGYNEIRNLQIALNIDKNLTIKLKADGKWGESTKKAVIAYQDYYKLMPKDGWVGKDVKASLDRTAKGILFPKDKIIKEKKGAESGRKSYYVASNIHSFKQFKKQINLKKSFAGYKNNKLLRQANRHNTKIVIDISDQRVTLFVKGKVALNSPCTTGAKHKFEPNTKIYRDKRTPRGNFRVLEKIRDKRSTIFGNFYRNGKRVYHGDRRKYRGKKRGLRYVGASLKYWMRLNSNGIGLHQSQYIKRNPGTNGCIRLPHSVAKIIFSKIGVGTRVHIQR